MSSLAETMRPASQAMPRDTAVVRSPNMFVRVMEPLAAVPAPEFAVRTPEFVVPAPEFAVPEREIAVPAAEFVVPEREIAVPR
jgi:hypothetical protein